MVAFLFIFNADFLNFLYNINFIEAARDLEKKNERMEHEISAQQLKIEDLNNELRQIKLAHDMKESEQLQMLMAENQRLVHDFKGLFCQNLNNFFL